MMTHTKLPSEGSILTPALLLDEAQMLRNIQTMQARFADTSVVLRPHVKTAKSLPVIERMVEGDPAPRLTVSTLREAAEVVAAGYRDVLYAVGVVPQKLPELKRLANRYQARISVILDSLEMAHALVAAQDGEGGAEQQERGEWIHPGVDAFIELDVDDHRAGVAPDSPELAAIGQLLHTAKSSHAKSSHAKSDNTKMPGAPRVLGNQRSLLRGVMTHAGGAYDCPGRVELEAMAERERSGAVRAADALRAVGVTCNEVSIGSTPTVHAGTSLAGVTEARVGVYVFNDLVMAGLGVCQQQDIAISVLSTVIGHQPGRNTLLIDAGWMALSSDRSTAAHRLDQGLGLVLSAGAGESASAADLIVASANQEHGLVTSRSGAPVDFARYPIGTQLQVLPVHACATAAQFNGYHVLSQRLSSSEFWPRFGGWHA